MISHIDTNKVMLIWGCGGHGRSVSNVAQRLGFRKVLFIDPGARHNESVNEIPVYSDFDCMSVAEGFGSNDCVAIPCNGNSDLRFKQLSAIEALGLELRSVISQRASVSPTSSIAGGVFVGDFCHVGPRSNIGRAVILNTGSIVEHDSSIGELSHVSVNAAVCGNSKVGSRTMIGAGSTVIDSVTISSDVTVAAGACVVSDLTLKGLYKGVPAKFSG